MLPQAYGNTYIQPDWRMFYTHVSTYSRANFFTVTPWLVVVSTVITDLDR